MTTGTVPEDSDLTIDEAPSQLDSDLADEIVENPAKNIEASHERDMLALETQVAPKTPFTIDGVVYEMRDMRHLDLMEEARFYTLIERDKQVRNTVATYVSKGQNERAEKLATRIYALRDAVIRHMTNVPDDVLAKLPNVAKQRLITNIIRASYAERSAKQENDAERAS